MKHSSKKRTGMVLMALIAGISALFLNSCESKSMSYSPVFISHFGFDSFTAFKAYTFYIDNFAHKIYNTDSFPFRSRVDSLYPTIVAGSDDGSFTMDGKPWSAKDTMDFSDCPIRLTFTAANGEDTYSYDIYVNVYHQDPDSLQMHRVAALPTENEYRVIVADGQFVLIESDGTATSMYRSYDCIEWEGPLAVDIPCQGAKIIAKSLSCLGSTAFMIDDNGGLYSSRLRNASGNYSSDGLRKWTKVGNAPYMTTLMGILEGRSYPNGDSDHDALLAMVQEDGMLHQAKFLGYWKSGLSDPSATQGWSCNEEAIPEDFPVKSFACSDNCTKTGFHFITLVGGIDADGNYCQSSWSTMAGDGSSSQEDGYVYWARTSTDYGLIGGQADASMFYYDNRLFLFGGKHAGTDGATAQDTTLYVSTDQGLSWEVAENKLSFFEFDKTSRCRQIISDGIYIWIFTCENGVEEVWKGYINKMLSE